MKEVLTITQYNISKNTPVMVSLSAFDDVLYESAVYVSKNSNKIPNGLSLACKYAPTFKEVMDKAISIAKQENKHFEKEIIYI